MTQSSNKNNKLLPVFTFLIIFFVVGLLNLKLFSSFLIPMLMGSIFAIMIHPLYKKMCKKNLPAFLSAFIATFLISAVIVLPTVLFTFTSVRQAQQIAANNKDSASKSSNKTNDTVDEVSEKISETGVIKSLDISKAEIAKKGKVYIKKASSYISLQFINILKRIPQALFGIFISLLSCFFFLLDGPKLVQFMNSRLPLGNDTKTQLFNSYRDTVGGVTIGSLVAALAQACIIFVGFLTLDIPNLFLAAFATFIFAWIPILGCLPVIVAGLIYLYTKDRYIAMFILGAIGIVTGLVDNIIRPKFLQGRNELHPLISLLAIFGGIDLFGIVGVFIGPIIAAIFITLLEIWPKIGKNLGYQFTTAAHKDSPPSSDSQS